MAKKKEKAQVINNIQELNLEIDYNKLAEAIVKAENSTKSNEKTSFTAKSISLYTSSLLKGFSVTGFILAFVIFVAMLHVCPSLDWKGGGTIILGNIIGIISIVAVVLLIVFFCITMWISAKEIQKENDKNYIIAIFSALVSFAALIISLVALFKGVG